MYSAYSALLYDYYVISLKDKNTISDKDLSAAKRSKWLNNQICSCPSYIASATLGKVYRKRPKVLF